MASQPLKKKQIQLWYINYKAKHFITLQLQVILVHLGFCSAKCACLIGLGNPGSGGISLPGCCR